MTLADDLAADYANIDGIETVTHTTSSGTQTATVKALRVDPNYLRIGVGGPVGLETVEVVWELWTATLGSSPARGETITDSAGVVWWIQWLRAVPNPADRSLVLKWSAGCNKSP